MRIFKSILALSFIVLLVAADAASLTAQGTIEGNVADENGVAIAFAQIFIEGTQRGAVADRKGMYMIRNVPAGTHTLRASFIGYKPQIASVTVRMNETVTQNFSMPTDVLDLEGTVVTGARQPLTKKESSVAITTLNVEQIEARAPRSTADLLKAVPGFYVESSGGEVGGNLFARGLPADGSFRYVAMMEEGMPVYDSTELSFVNADIFVRVDENINNIEAVRGGNAALFGSNAPGGLVNFISKTGGPQLAGTVKAQVGSGGMNRYDINVNGPIGENTFFSFGGFYRFDDGIRDPGFPVSNGGQIKANMTHFFDTGYFKIYGKHLNDRNIFYLPLPFKAGKDPDYVRGFPDDGTLTTVEGNFVTVPRPNNNGDLTLPLEDGQKQIGTTIIGDFGLDLGDDWSLQNTIRFMTMDHSWNAVVPFDLVDANDFAQGYLDGAPTGSRAVYSFTNHDELFNAFNTKNDLLLTAGLWHVEKPMTNVSNQLQVKKTVENHNFTFGTYFGHYTADNLWFFNDILTDVRNAPRFVDLVIEDAAGNVNSQVTENGFRRYGSLYVNSFGNVSLAAFFAGDEVQVNDQLRIDLGIRYEHDRFEQNHENTAGFDLGGSSLADDNVSDGIGTFTRADEDFNEWALSGGANYSVNDNIAIYGRASRGFKMPILDNYLFGGKDLKAEQLIQVEGGVKIGTPQLGISAAAYWLRLEDFPSQDLRVVNGETVYETDFVGQARTVGGEVEAIFAPDAVPGVKINWILTLQDPEYTDFIEGEEDLSGNQVRRIARFISDATFSYSNSGFNASLGWNHIGKRYSNNANTIELPSYDVTNASVAYTFPTGITLGVNVSNIMNGHGLTEGNPRLDESAAQQGLVFLARPILPRRTVAYLSYDF